MSKLAELTGGNVERYDPKDLTSKVDNFVSQPIIASNVTLTVKLHKGLRFRREDPQSLKDGGSVLVKDIGNVT